MSARIDERIERVPTEHDEMHWRLIRLGQLAKCDVWVPRNDQPKQYEGHQFRDFVLREFHETLDVPRSIENIDVVWKFGRYSIKSAFEIEHSTSVYSGILRLSDLRAEAPNSNYPLFIVASEDRRRKVFEELRRPTFSGPCLRLNEVIRFLGTRRSVKSMSHPRTPKTSTRTVCGQRARVFRRFTARGSACGKLSPSERRKIVEWGQRVD